MKKVLGLDIGSNSIGWALVHEPTLDDETYAIAGMGVRIIPLSSDENDEFTKGNAMSKNAGRTQKRGARRNLQRYKLRRHQLTALLKGLGMMPEKELFELDALTLYGLRAKGVTEQLSLQEIGRVFYHLNQKRGYKSNRKANNDEEQTDSKVAEQTEDTSTRQKKKGYLDFINDREQALRDEGITIGQHFYSLLLKRETEQIAEAVRIKENIYLRSTYMDEFDRIWNKQQTYYSDVLTDANKQKIRNETIYYQRPLRSQKGLVSNCLFEHQHKAAPKSSPLFQVNKIWQELNNIELTSFKAMRGREDGFDAQGKRKPTLEEKQRLFEQLNVKGKLTTKECLKELGYQSGYDEYKLNIRNEKELEGNRTYSAIKKVFDKFKVNRDDLLQFNLGTSEKEIADKQTGEVFTEQQINPAFEQEPLFQLWHLLYSIEENETLIAKLQSRYGLAEDVAKTLAKIDFAKQGYGSLSAKALRKIVPYLQQGYDYSEASSIAGYNHSNSITKAENELRPILDKLELYPKNSLRQPVVEKIINQVINLVNEIIDEKNGFVTNTERHAIDQFEIRVELARELRQNAEERNKTYSRNNKLDRRHKEIIEIIKQYLPYKRVTKNDIERYKLWEEFGKVSPYEPERPVSLGLLFSGEYDIEHIIPKSRLFDDSFTNKTICRRVLNSGSLNSKNQMTAHDFMKSQGEQAFLNYVEFIKTHLYKKDGISKGKFNKLMTAADKIPEDFINRQLQETRFISKEVKQLLTKISRNVYATSGSVTDYLRHHWGYDAVLQKINWHKYEHAGKTTIEPDKNGKPIYRITDWSKRDDHRHHAIDALVIACTRQSYIQQLNNLNQVVEKKQNQTNQDAIKEMDIKTQIPFNFQRVIDATDNILISFKSGKKVAGTSTNKIKKADGIKKEKETIPRGFLHKETVFGRIKQFEEVALSTRFDRFADIVRPEIKTQLIDYIRKFDNNIKDAFNIKNLAAFKEQYGYNKIIVYRHEHVVRYKLDANFKAADAEYIVDQGIKAIIKAHLAKHGDNPKIAFNGDVNNVIWLNETKGIPVRSVRCFTGYTDLQALHTNEQGKPIDFVVTGNNHHIAIYRDENGKLQENTVSFWDAVKRKQAKLSVIIKEPVAVWDMVINSGFDDQDLMKGLPQPNWIYQTSLQQNEMFVFGLAQEELELAINTNNHALISKHLYRTQKMSKKSSGAIDLWFRHHLETKLDDTSIAKELKKYINIQSLNGMNGIKVKVNNIGQIVKV